MTLSLPRFRSTAALVLALAYTALTFGATIAPTAAEARASGPYYTAELTAPAAESRFVEGGVVWYCEGTTCAAAKGTSRPLNICRKLSREVGQITSFTAKGEALEAEQLARCNGE